MAFAVSDPLARLSWVARARWRRAERRVRKEFESDTLAELRQLARGDAAVSWITVPDATSHIASGILGPVELSAGGRRIVARAVWGPAWLSLSKEATRGRVALSGAGRYGGSWFLRFKVVALDENAAWELPLLGAGVRILPHSGGERHDFGVGPPRSPALV